MVASGPVIWLWYFVMLLVWVFFIGGFGYLLWMATKVLSTVERIEGMMSDRTQRVIQLADRSVTALEKIAENTGKTQ